MTLLDLRRPRSMSPPPAHRAAAASPRSPRSWTARHAAMCVLFVALCLNQDAGRVFPDTKIDLTVDPGSFLRRALTLWDGQGFAGQVQNQAYGYLFPMGPFHALLHAAGVPDWVVQRLWWATLLSVAYLGVVRLARALGLGTPLSAMIAGAAYAASPHVLTLLSANSVEALPMCVAPWIVLPLVRGASDGSPRRAGLLCGLAVLFMGGVNAAADLAALVPAALFLLAHRPSRRVLALAGWAAGGVLLATLWWVVPLVLLGRFSPPFLDWIENGLATTSVTNLAEVLRGTSDWVAYLPSSGWQAGHLLLTEPVLIIDSLIVAGLGLIGIATARSPHRTWLVGCLALGLVAVTFGHGGVIGSAFAGHERALLDAVLAPLRNIHKFDVLLRLPLVLGLAALLPRLTPGRTARERQRASWFARAVVVAAVVGAALPLLALQVPSTHSYAGIPGYWTQTARWLDGHAENGRSLLVPASATPSYLWGTPTDEPLQALTTTASWEVRNNVPLVDAGHVRVLDEIDRRLAAGTRDTTLAAYVARTGIRYLIVRNDLDYRTVGATAPAIVDATLEASPGLERVKTFGPVVGGVGDYSFSNDQSQSPPAPAIEIWRVGAGTGDPRIDTTTTLTRLSGGPEATSGAADVLAGTPTGATRTSSTVVTDTLRRREVNYGGAAGQHSVTLRAGETGPLGRRVMDYLPVAGAEHQSVVRYLGARSITASSTAAVTDGFSTVVPDAQPWSAFDGDPHTSWRTTFGSVPTGQWTQVVLARPVALPSVTVRLLAYSRVTRLAVTTDQGTRYATVTNDRATVPLSGARTGSVRVAVAAVRGKPLQVSIAEITLPGVELARTVVVPRDVSGTVDGFAFSTAGDARTGCVLVGTAPLCVAGRARGGEDGTGLDRSFVVAKPASYTASVTLTPRPGAALERLLAAAAPPVISADASSRAVPDPLAGPQSLVDRDLTTGWVADPDDADPTITLHWTTPARLSSLTLVTSAAQPATRPDFVALAAPGGRRTAVIDSDGVVRFAPLTTNQLTIHLGSSIGLRPVYGSSTGRTRVGIGLEEIVVPGVAGVATTSRAATAASPVTLPCGTGPDLIVDGRRVATGLRTTVGALRDLRPVTATVCDPDVRFAAGTHRLRTVATSAFGVGAATLTRSAATVETPAAGATVVAWHDTDRTVRVAARTTRTVLIVNENANPGWRATLGGRRLPTITVDGWRQGYVLPAGRAAEVHLAYAPQRTYRLGLLVGAGAVVALLALLVLSRRARPDVRVARAARPYGRAVVLVAGLACCVLVAGAAGLAVAVAVTALMWLVRRLRASAWVAPLLIAVPVLGVAALLALHPSGTPDYAAGDPLTQLLCVVAIAATAAGAGLARPTKTRPTETTT